MTAVRRRLIRPAASPAPDRQRQLQRLRERLNHERTALVRWQTKFKRAFNAVERFQRSVVRLERRIHQLEE